MTSWRSIAASPSRNAHRFLDNKWLFRGVASVRYPLVPSVGRQRDGYVYEAARETTLFEQFKREALPFLAAKKSGKTLAGHVKFHLHDTFADPERRVRVSRGKAVLNLEAYGAFTVGILVERDRTMLELDLAETPGAPKRFREQ